MIRKLLLAAATGIGLIVFAAPALGQVYKWVDAKGQTHYTSNKAEADAAKGAEVKLKVTPGEAPPPAAKASGPKGFTPGPDGWPAAKPAPLRVPTAPERSLSGGKEDGSNASRCQLARDVLAGKLAHRNGKPMDQYDMDTARNDVAMFCGQ